MGKSLGVDWVGDQFSIVEFSENNGVAKPFQLSLPVPVAPENTAALATLLKDSLRAAGVSASEVTVLVDRVHCNGRLVTVPHCPDHELPLLVRYASDEAAENGGTGEAGTSILDFQARPTSNEQREVWVGAVAEKTLKTLGEILKSAGLSPTAIVPRIFAEWIGVDGQRPLANGRNVLLALHPSAMEISIWSGAQLLLWRQITLPSAGMVNRARSETMRSLLAAPADAEGVRQQIVLMGERAPDLAEAFVGLIDADVVVLPAQISEAGSPTAWSLHLATLAAKRASRSGDWPVNFLAPKNPAPPKDRRKSLLMIAGSAVALFLLAMIGLGMYQVSAKAAEIERVRQDLSRSTAETKGYEPIVQRHKIMKEWFDTGVLCLEELCDLTGSMPDTADAYLTQLSMTAGQPGQTGQITLSGRARKSEIIVDKENEWSRDATGRYRVNPRGINPTNDSDFAWSFDLDMETKSLPADVYAKRAENWLAATKARAPKGDMVRLPIALRGASSNTRARPESSPTAGAVASVTTPTAQTTSDSQKASDSETRSESSNDGRRSRRDRSSSNTSSTTSPPTSSAETSSSETDPNETIKKYVQELKALPYEQREAKLNKTPKLIQKRLRQLLQESR